MLRSAPAPAFFSVVIAISLIGCSKSSSHDTQVQSQAIISPTLDAPPIDVNGHVYLTKAEWRKRLSSEQFHILREKGTEPSFSGAYWNHKEKGVYKCAACQLQLFDSSTKFKSGTGWPSFWKPANEQAVFSETDNRHGMHRTEVLCRRCKSHLGHVFEDGPAPTGLRYCINSSSLSFESKP